MLYRKGGDVRVGNVVTRRIYRTARSRKDFPVPGAATFGYFQYPSDIDDGKGSFERMIDGFSSSRSNLRREWLFKPGVMEASLIKI